jgi:hypothetical protein
MDTILVLLDRLPSRRFFGDLLLIERIRLLSVKRKI